MKKVKTKKKSVNKIKQSMGNKKKISNNHYIKNGMSFLGALDLPNDIEW
jgi:hypothetical protein